MSAELNLGEKLGMIITPSAVVGKVTPGTQAESIGITSGAKILSIGGFFNLNNDHTLIRMCDL